MKNFLPRTLNTSKGFTLVELMVVIAIIAILSVVGLTIFSGVQQQARNSRRQSDIQAIAKALESAKQVNVAAYASLTVNSFAGGTIPNESAPTTARYCISTSTTVTVPPQPGVAAWNGAANICPTAGGYVDVAAAPGGVTALPVNTLTWRLCAVIEPYSATAATFYCNANSQ